MTKEGAVAVGRDIKVMYFPKVKSVRSDLGNTSEHLVWMIDQLPSLSVHKAMRWLGYIQGAMVAWEIAELDEMKEISRKHAE